MSAATAVVPARRSTEVALSARSRLDYAVAHSAAVVTTRIHTSLERFRNREEDGMTTAEYAIGIVAAVALAGLLVAVVTSGKPEEMIADIITKALTPPKV